ncbi:molybdopterin cofactor-binding domain-containing protein [Tardiphaga sp.]|jgi:xanthine dehydrogenase YagR molybdenum-binding subunit|uniref:molybdopterin cofactor-binding domain-containing protein n=1 Tax=Tardiphaga sp. TaxID=1926292 RepID=UPI0037DA4AF4
MTSNTTTVPTPGRFIGRPVDRVDGRLKVTGGARYAFEHSNLARGTTPAYGVILGAGIPKGRITTLDTTRAEAIPGVLKILTYRNMAPQPAFGAPMPPNVPDVFTRARPMLSSDEILYYDQPVALVIAATWEAARGAAALIDIRYMQEPGFYDPLAAHAERYKPARINAGFAPDTAHGDADAALAAASITIDQTYRLPYEIHAPMEPHATLAQWDGERLTLHTSTQTIANIQSSVAASLAIPRGHVRVISPFVGGGFGSKLIPHAEAILAAIAAREMQRPVKVAFTRQQMFANAGHRPAMEQRIRLAADGDGRLTALVHDVTAATSRFEEFAEQSGVVSRSFYASATRRTTHRLVRVDTNRGEWMRAPGEASGLLALECAMDEMAERLTLDPIEFRIRNEPERDPETGAPFSSRNLIACMREGAQRFGWAQRSATPGARREGRKLVGIGMAGAMRPNYIGPAQARVAIDRSGQVTVQTDMTDIGTGTYTILAQIAAERLGLPLQAITVELGDSNLPRSPGSGGSWGAASSGTAVHNACLALCQKIADAARSHAASPLRGADPMQARFEEASLTLGDRSAPLAELIAQTSPDGLDATGSAARGETYKTFSQHAFGAHFAEVAVDIDTGEVRLRRMLGVFAAGKILNPKTARSQMIGGMIWGVGSALTEAAMLDPRYGHFVNHDLAEYQVPVHADIPDIDVIFLDEDDDKGNPLGIKGIGELGNCGANAAVVNAVYNACGVRVRELPVTLDKVLAGMA